MANLRQLSAYCLSLSLLAGSWGSTNSYGNQEELKNPPPTNKIFYEYDLWSHAANKEWAFSYLLLSAIKSPERQRIDGLKVSKMTKVSLHTIREAFRAADTQNQVKTANISDLVYAYSWDNSPALGHAFSGLQAFLNKIDRTGERYVSFYKNHKIKSLIFANSLLGGSLVATAIVKGIKVPVANPPAQGNFISRRAKTLWSSTVALAAASKTVLLAHPYILLGIGAGYLVYDGAVTAANWYYDIPVSMMFYTDLIAGGDGSDYEATYTNSIYGFSSQEAVDYYNGYIDMNTYNTMLHGLLVYGKNIHDLKFGAVPGDVENLLTETSNSIYLSPTLYTPFLPDYFDQTGEQYKTGQATYKQHVAEVVNKAFDPSSGKADCRKLVLFNNALSTSNSNPLYLFSLCSIGDTLAYAKLPSLPYVRLKKENIVGFVQELMEYTGSTRLVVMSKKIEE